MIGVICTAGNDVRMGGLLEEAGVATKSLLPVGASPIILKTISELKRFGVDDILIVATQKTVDVLYDVTGVRTVPQMPGPYGTAAAVATAITTFGHDKDFLISWGDMVFKMPNKHLPGNVLYTCGVSQSKSSRFEGVVCSGDRVLAISPRSVQKQGPYLMTTGVCSMSSTEDFLQIYKIAADLMYKNPVELPFEKILQEMIYIGIPVFADCLDFFIDFGTRNEYENNLKLLLE